MSRLLLARAALAALFATVILVSPDLIVPVIAQGKTPLYYQDPDGKPDYSPVPKKTADGRDYAAFWQSL